MIRPGEPPFPSAPNVITAETASPAGNAATDEVLPAGADAGNAVSEAFGGPANAANDSESGSIGALDASLDPNGSPTL